MDVHREKNKSRGNGSLRGRKRKHAMFGNDVAAAPTTMRQKRGE